MLTHDIEKSKYAAGYSENIKYMTAVIIIKSPKELGTKVAQLFIFVRYYNATEKYGLILC